MAYQLGLPVFVYGNLVDNNTVIVAAALFIIAVNLAMCWVFRKK